MSQEIKIKEFSNNYNLGLGLVETISDNNRLKTVIEDINSGRDINIEITRFIYNVDYFKELESKLQTQRESFEKVAINEIENRKELVLTIQKLETEVRQYKINILNTATTLYNVRDTDNILNVKKFFFSGNVKDAFNSINTNSLEEAQKTFNEILDHQQKLDDVYERLVDNASEFEVKAGLTLLNIEIIDYENRYQKYIELCEKGKISAIRSKKSQFISVYIFNFAINIKENNDFRKAEELFLESLQISDDSDSSIEKKRISQALVLGVLNDLYIKACDFPKAVETYNKLIDIYTNYFPENKKLTSTLLNDLGRLMINLKRYDLAIEYLMESVQNKEWNNIEIANEDSLSLAKTLYNLGLAYKSINYIDKAIIFYSDASKIFARCLEAKIESSLLIHNLYSSLSSLGELYAIKFDFKKSTEIHKNVISELREYVKKFPRVHNSELAHALNSYGISLTKEGSNNIRTINNKEEVLNEAANCFKESLEIRKKLYEINTGFAHISMSLNNLGTTLTILGRHEEAIKYLEEAINIWAEKNNQFDSYLPDLAMSYLNLSTALRAQKEFEKAINVANNALQLYEESLKKNLIDDLPYAKCLYGFGEILISNNQMHDAKNYLTKALSIYTNLSPESQKYAALEIIGCYNSLSSIYIKTGQNGMTTEFLMHSLRYYISSDTLIESKANSEHAITFQRIGTTLVNNGQFELAIKSYEYSIFVWGKIEKLEDKDFIEYAVTFNDFGYALQCLKQYSEAEVFYKKAIEIHRNTLDESVKNCKHLAIVFFNLINLYIEFIPNIEFAKEHLIELGGYITQYPVMNIYSDAWLQFAKKIGYVQDNIKQEKKTNIYLYLIIIILVIVFILSMLM
jgi:tetratricopeptide (TPR) repeat protein